MENREQQNNELLPSNLGQATTDPPEIALMADQLSRGMRLWGGGEGCGRWVINPANPQPAGDSGLLDPGNILNQDVLLGSHWDCQGLPGGGRQAGQSKGSASRSPKPVAIDGRSPRAEVLAPLPSAVLCFTESVPNRLTPPEPQGHGLLCLKWHQARRFSLEVHHSSLVLPSPQALFFVL